MKTTSFPDKPSARKEGAGESYTAGMRGTLGFYTKQHVHKVGQDFPGPPLLSLKLAMHMKNIQVVFSLSPFKFLSKLPHRAALGKTCSRECWNQAVIIKLLPRAEHLERAL